jgi:hypothetical protein
MNKENPGVGSAKRTDENQNPRAYLKGINGLRSIFVVPVILLHLIMHFDEYGLDPKLFGDSIIERRLGMAVFGLGVFYWNQWLSDHLSFKTGKREKRGHQHQKVLLEKSPKDTSAILCSDFRLPDSLSNL